MEQQQTLQNNRGAIIFIPDEGDIFYVETNSQNTIDFLKTLGYEYEHSEWFPYYGAVYYYRFPKSLLADLIGGAQQNATSEGETQTSGDTQNLKQWSSESPESSLGAGGEPENS